MPGLVGICGRTIHTSREQVHDATMATVYTGKVQAKSIYDDTNLILCQSGFRFLDQSGLTATDGNVLVWIDGEIFNTKDMEQGVTPAMLIHKHYVGGSLDRLLATIDGVFICLIYDAHEQELHLISDRFGLKIFYLSVRNNCLVFAPELKCFPFFKEFETTIRKDVIDCFIDLGHLMGSTTWLENVYTTDPSTIYSYSLETSRLRKRKYWSWSAISRDPISFNDAADQLGTLLNESVNARYIGAEEIGIALSGGFDSRAILAAMQHYKPVTYTFGIESSPDVKIARQVAKYAGVPHVHYEMHVKNWLERRFSGVWKTDGMLNMYHMHYSHLMNEIAKIMDVNLSGFLGDAVVGGTYLSRKRKTFLDKHINEDIARHYYGEHFKFSDVEDPFFDIDKIDAYLFYNRGRRLIGLGMEEANKMIYQRMPFMDINLLDFVYSLPDDFRKDSKVYFQALVQKYPDFYRNFPHATSGVPIDNSVITRGKKFFYWSLTMLKVKLGMVTSFTDVQNWIRQPHTAALVRTILDPKQAIYRNFTDKNFLRLYVEPHLTGKGNFMKELMGALTMEIWLQQILNKKYL